MKDSAHACAKAILIGEHFVLYDSPSIALPLLELRLTVRIQKVERGHLSVFDRNTLLDQPEVYELVSKALSLMGVTERSWDVRIISDIPLGCGLGSSAALSVALIRELGRMLGEDIPLKRLNSLAFELEKVSHGSPSGLDNSVISAESPVWFEMGSEPELLSLPALCFVLADSGIRGSTVHAVESVRARGQERPEWLRALASESRKDTVEMRRLLSIGDETLLGALLNRAHQRLRDLGVSTDELDTLQKAALEAGALGAKLTGAGRGGCVLALVDVENATKVAQGLLKKGARNTWVVRTGGS